MDGALEGKKEAEHRVLELEDQLTEEQQRRKELERQVAEMQVELARLKGSR